MKTNIFTLLSAILFCLTAGCSNNIDGVYKPYGDELTLEVAPAGGSFSGGNGNERTLNPTSETSQTPISVRSNTQWKVTVNCPDGWCTASTYRGTGNGTFNIEVLQNNVGDERRCTVTINTIDAEGNIVGSENGGKAEAFNVVQSSGSLYIAPREVDPFPANNPTSRQFEIVSREVNVKWTLTVSYEASQSIAFMTVTPNDENMTSTGSDGLNAVYSGNGNASFTLELASNQSSAERVGFLTLNSDISNYTVEISQLGTEYNFSVTALNPGVVPGTGGEIQYEIYAPNIGWEIQGIPQWIEFSETKGESTGGGTHTVTAMIKPNLSTEDRSNPAVITFVPTGANSESYANYTTQIAQAGIAFGSDNDGNQEQPVNAAGETRTIQFASDLNWKLETSQDWVKADKTEGTASDRSVTLTFDPFDGNTRNATVRIIPAETKFGDDTYTDFSNIAPIEFRFTQFGGKEASVSTPWPTNIEKTSVSIDFNYHTLSAQARYGGIEWRKAGSSENWQRVQGDIEKTDENTGSVKVKLSNLTEATDYEARGYIICSGDPIYSETLKFKTAGSSKVKPGGNDNPTPGV